MVVRSGRRARTSRLCRPASPVVRPVCVHCVQTRAATCAPLSRFRPPVSVGTGRFAGPWLECDAPTNRPPRQKAALVRLCTHVYARTPYTRPRLRARAALRTHKSTHTRTHAHSSTFRRLSLCAQVYVGRTVAVTRPSHAHHRCCSLSGPPLHAQHIHPCLKLSGTTIIHTHRGPSLSIRLPPRSVSLPHLIAPGERRGTRHSLLNRRQVV